jgi:hypothetical protein
MTHLLSERAIARTLVVALAATTFLPLIGAGGSASATTPVPQLAKSYTGAARNNTAGKSAVISLRGITQSGGSIAGTFSFHAPLAGSGQFVGTITSTRVAFTVKTTQASCPTCTSIVFAGAVSPVVSMGGTFVSHQKSGHSQVGTWTVGSTWTGPAHNITVDRNGTVTLVNVTELPNGQVTGGVVWGGGLCGNGAFKGTIAGSKFRLVEGQPSCEPPSWVYSGTVDLATGTLSGKYVTPVQRGTYKLRRLGAAPKA